MKSVAVEMTFTSTHNASERRSANNERALAGVNLLKRLTRRLLLHHAPDVVDAVLLQTAVVRRVRGDCFR